MLGCSRFPELVAVDNRLDGGTDSGEATVLRFALPWLHQPGRCAAPSQAQDIDRLHTRSQNDTYAAPWVKMTT